MSQWRRHTHNRSFLLLAQRGQSGYVVFKSCRLPYKGTNFSVNQNAKITKNRGIILTNGGCGNAQNCINIHSNCIIMQFWEGWLLMGSGALVVGRDAKLKPKKFGITFW